MRFTDGVMIVAVLIIVSGCGHDGPALVQVAGTLVDEGKPVEGALIEFTPQDGRPSTGMTAADGSFRLRYTPERIGVLPGDHRVKVTTGVAAYDAQVKPGEPVPATVPPMKTFESKSPISVDSKSKQIQLDVHDMVEKK